MPRTTLHRKFTDKENDLAKQVIDTVIEEGGTVTTAKTLAELVGISRRRLYSIMPRVAELAAETFPGSTIVPHLVKNQYRYELTSDPDVSLQVVESILKRLATTARHIAADMEPLRGRTDFASVAALNTGQTLLASLHEDMLNAIFDQARDARAKGATIFTEQAS